MFEITLPLSRYLQTINLDLAAAIDCAIKVEKSLSEMRETADTCFNNIFTSVSNLCEQYDISILKPRTVGRQTHRENMPADSPEEYYRRTIFIPFLDETIESLKSKFISQKETLRPFQYLLSSEKFMDQAVEELRNLLKFYDLEDADSSIKGELLIWKKTLEQLKEKPKSAIQALPICNKDIFPLIQVLLTIMATLPVTSCTCERSFSTIKILKDYLRNSTGEERLNGLALMYMHTEISVSVDEVLDKLAEKCRRIVLK